jgi:hypothetical protein
MHPGCVAELGPCATRCAAPRPTPPRAPALSPRAATSILTTSERSMAHGGLHIMRSVARGGGDVAGSIARGMATVVGGLLLLLLQLAAYLAPLLCGVLGALGGLLLWLGVVAPAINGLASGLGGQPTSLIDALVGLCLLIVGGAILLFAQLWTLVACPVGGWHLGVGLGSLFASLVRGTRPEPSVKGS